MIKQCGKCGVLYNTELQKDDCPHYYYKHSKGVVNPIRGRKMEDNRLKRCWCDKCDDYREPNPKRWETNKAVVIDHECGVCGEILLRIPRDVTFKVPEPPREVVNKEPQIEGLGLTPEEIKGLLVEYCNWCEEQLLPDCPEDRNIYTIENMDSWVDPRNYKLIDLVYQAQLKKAQGR